MSGTHGTPALSDDDFDAIAAAVADTARGRWFLAEYARRNRNADTGLLLDAIHKLAAGPSGGGTLDQIERVRVDLVEMAKTIVRLKAEIAADRPDSGFAEAKGALDDVVRTTEAATSSILAATEQIQEMAWTLREAGADASVCDLLDRRAGDIYTACTFQDLTAQRTQKVVQTLRYLEGRLNGLIDAWSTERRDDAPPAPPTDEPALALLAGATRGIPDTRPAAQQAELTQDDVDIVIIEHDGGDEALWLEDEEPVAVPAETEFDSVQEGDISFEDIADPMARQPAIETVATGDATPPAAAPARPPQDASPGDLHALSAIDRLPTTAKLSLFG